MIHTNTLDFLLCTLAVWRVAYLFSQEDGPFDLVVKIRKFLGQSVLGKLMDCFACLSVWIAAPTALLLCKGWVDWIVLWLALSGGACILFYLLRKNPE